MLLAGGALGLAEITKGAWLILYFLWPMLYIFWLLLAPRPIRWKEVGNGWLQGIGIVVISILVINSIYLFDATGTPFGEFEFSGPLRSTPSDDVVAAATGNRFRGTPLGLIPVPLPKQYILGIDTQWTEFERGKPAYLLGEWKFGGWWYYYLIAMLFKIPLGAWLLAIISILVRLRRKHNIDALRNEMVLLAPAVAMLLVISLQGGINRHFRYVLPALPFLYVWISSAATLIGSVECKGVRGEGGVGAAIIRLGRSLTLPGLTVIVASLWFVISSLSVFPHSQTYFNELCGGSMGGPKILLGSSVEWGQDLFFLKRWINKHPQSRPLYISFYTPSAPPQLAGIDFPMPPDKPERGWYVVSVNRLYDPKCRFAYLRNFEHVDRVAYSMRVYQLTERDISVFEKGRSTK